MRNLPEEAFTFLSSEDVEGLRLTAYPDPATKADPWTIGVGHTGPEVHRGYTITLDRAMDLLRLDLEKARRQIYSVAKPAVIDELTDHQYAALLSFVFNLGLYSDATIWKRLNARQFDQIPLELVKWDKATIDGRKVKLRGLTKRRAMEVILWSHDEPGSVNINPSSAQVRQMETPPTPADPTPPARSAVVLTSAAGTLATAPAMINQVKDTLAPLAPTMPSVERVIAILAVIGVGLTIATIVLIWLHKRLARS